MRARQAAERCWVRERVDCRCRGWIVPRPLAEGRVCCNMSWGGPAARAEVDWRREAEKASGWVIGGVAIGIVGPVWRSASMVGRCATPRGVEKMSAGRSDYRNVCSVKKTGKMSKRNAP